jgi:CrcB protein
MLWFIAAGGALGSVCRFLLTGVVQRQLGTGFPYGTLVVNVTGSLLLGILLRYSLDTPGVSPEARALLATGFCGGYTTFSAFSYETMALLQAGDYRRAVGYAVASVVISLLAMYAGLEFARVLIAARRAA